ncbi:MAG: MFS transporter [Nanoarchaeota archaeon]|nr:MFS transporter [Nanoarchaeota archaeon]
MDDKEKTVKLMYLDTVYAAIKEGVNANFVLPFAIAMNAGSQYLALISSMPQLLGSFCQLFSADLMNLLKKRKTVIVFAALIDALMWIPLMLMPMLWSDNIFLLLNILVIQAIANSLLSPFFNSLLGDIMPQEERGKITSKLNQISGFMSLISSVIAGFVLAVFKPINPFFGFSLIFFLAFFARLVSTMVKSKFIEPEVKEAPKFESFFHFTRNIRKSNFGQFVMYNSWIKFAVGMSAPFFTVYMLKDLNMDFLTFTLINSAAIISSFVVLQAWGRSIDKEGSRKMLAITGFLIPTIPLLWIVFRDAWILFVIEIFSGAVWAGYNLATSNFVIDATKSENRLIMMSYHNFFIGVATFVGAMLGGLLVYKLPLDYMGNVNHFIFGLSAFLRLCFSLYFMRKIKEERFVDVELHGPLSKRIISILPKQGAIFDFIPRKKGK